MKLKNIFIGLGCVLAFSSCTNEMDYHEYTVYGKDYVFTDFTRTSGFVTNIYSYLDSDLPSNGSLSSGVSALACRTAISKLSITLSVLLI